MVQHRQKMVIVEPQGCSLGNLLADVFATPGGCHRHRIGVDVFSYSMPFACVVVDDSEEDWRRHRVSPGEDHQPAVDVRRLLVVEVSEGENEQRVPADDE